MIFQHHVNIYNKDISKFRTERFDLVAVKPLT